VNYPSTEFRNGAPDGIALVDAARTLVEFLSYEGTFTAVGGPARGPALPVSFEDQFFATLRDVNGTVIPAVFTWASETPALASIDVRGVVRAFGAGSAIVRATADDGSTPLRFQPVWRPPPPRSTHRTPNSESPPMTMRATILSCDAPSFRHRNRAFGTPNWVSYNLDASHFGNEDRCDCFTFDPALPADFPRGPAIVSACHATARHRSLPLTSPVAPSPCRPTPRGPDHTHPARRAPLDA